MKRPSPTRWRIFSTATLLVVVAVVIGYVATKPGSRYGESGPTIYNVNSAQDRSATRGRLKFGEEEIDGLFTIYIPPIEVTQPLLSSETDARFDSPEESHFSQVSASNKAWFLRCFDKSSQDVLREHDVLSGGKLFGSLAAVKGSPWPPKDVTRILERIELTLGNERVALLKIRTSKKSLYAVLVFVKEGGKWLRSFRYDEHPLVKFILQADTLRPRP